MRICRLVSVLLLSACAAKPASTWVPGPSAAVTDFGVQHGRCSLMARNTGQPGMVELGGRDTTLGQSFRRIVDQQGNYHDCMLANGWQLVAN